MQCYIFELHETVLTLHVSVLLYSYGEEKLQVWEVKKSMVKTILKVELLISCGISEVVK